MMITGVELTQSEYCLFRDLVYRQSGINLGDEKLSLVQSRLGKRLRESGLSSFRAYYDMVVADASGQELVRLLDMITTNTTHLFREPRHFDLLRSILQTFANDARRRGGTGGCVRIWSAACSSGEEPHSIAMVARHALADSGVECKILATDLSTRMLAKARQGRYDHSRLATVPTDYQRYLRPVQGEAGRELQVVPDVMRLIRFAQFNLMSPVFSFQHGFDVIFCRNVMIYFDRPTQETLMGKMAEHLRHGGYLMVGHSESLNKLNHRLEYVEPSVYRRAGEVSARREVAGGHQVVR